MLRENNTLRSTAMGLAVLFLLAMGLTPAAPALAQGQAMQEKPEQRHQESVQKQLRETTRQEHEGGYGHGDVKPGGQDEEEAPEGSVRTGHKIPGGDFGSDAAGYGGYDGRANNSGYPPRGDDTWGTMDENIYMGDDPVTGDRIIRVTPRPQPKPEPDPQIGPIIIEPKIEIPAQGKKP